MNNRRGFLRWIAIAAGSLVSLVPALTRSRFSSASSQSSPSPKPAATADSQAAFQKVGTVSQLKDGQLLVKEGFKPGPVLLVQDPKDAKKLAALNPTCTHKGCAVEWNADDGTLVCPCHDSRFSLDGKVVKGPAKDPLPVYMAKLEGENILVADSK